MSNEYALASQRPDFPPVEPEAGYWFRCPVLSTVPFKKIQSRIDDSVPPYPTDTATLQAEINELKQLYADRSQPYNQSRLSIFLTDAKFTTKSPVGAVLSTASTGNPRQPIIKTGLELATLFEAETPGLWHRHVLNVLLDPEAPDKLGQKLSPPLHALVWSALDVAIASALMAAWHYKWLAKGKDTVARRQRPAEYAKKNGIPFEVLFDYEVTRTGGLTGNIVRNAAKLKPQPSPGTPRHPAYPSGHSTYSAAASTVLGCLFPRYQNDFKKLAENIGEARLWGGVHWRTDDTVGRIIGDAVGQLVIEQLNETGIYQLLEPNFDIPSRDALEDEAKDFKRHCGKRPNDFCEGVPKPGAAAALQNVQN